MLKFVRLFNILYLCIKNFKKIGNMVEQIVDMVLRTIKKAIEKHAIEKEKYEHEVQICINTEDEETAEPKYRFLINFKKEDNPVTFNQMIGVKFVDIQGREMFVKPFLQKAFLYINKKENIPIKSINLIAILTKSGEVKLLLYNKEKYVKEITIDYVMNGVSEYKELTEKEQKTE